MQNNANILFSINSSILVNLGIDPKLPTFAIL